MTDEANGSKMYDPANLLKKWKLNKLTVEQAIGQLILRVMDLVMQFSNLESRQLAMNQRLRNLEDKLK